METANLLFPLSSSRSNLSYLSQAALQVESRPVVVRLEQQGILASRKIYHPESFGTHIQLSEDSQNKISEGFMAKVNPYIWAVSSLGMLC